MSRFFLAFTALLLLLSVACATPTTPNNFSSLYVPRYEQQQSVDPRVVGGTAVTDPSKYPFVGGISFRTNGATSGSYSICTGSLISPSWVLTAGHCEVSLTDGFVRFGTVDQISSFDCSAGSVPCRRIASHSHPASYVGANHDIALLKLASPVTYTSNVQPACLNNITYGSANNGGVTPSVKYVGFGLTSGGGSLPSKLQEALRGLPIREPCEWAGDVCMSSISPATDACNGDSGSGVQHWGNDGILVSVVSRGPSACTGGGVDTEVNAHLSWILGTVDEPVQVGTFIAPRSSCVTAQTVSTNKNSYQTTETVTVSYARMPSTITITVIGTSVSRTITGVTGTAQSGTLVLDAFSDVTVITSFTLEVRSLSSVVLASTTFTVSPSSVLLLSKPNFSVFEPITGTFAGMPASFSIVLNDGTPVASTGPAGAFSFSALTTTGPFTVSARDTNNAILASVTGSVQAASITASKSTFSVFEPVTGSVNYMPAAGCTVSLPLASGTATVVVSSSSGSFSLPAVGANAPTVAVQLTALDAGNTVLATSSNISFVAATLTLNGQTALLPADLPVTGTFSGMPATFQLRLDSTNVGSPLSGPSGTFSIAAPFVGGAHVVSAVTTDASATELASAGFVANAIVRSTKATYSSFENITGTYAGAAAAVSIKVAVTSAATNSATSTSSATGTGSFSLAPVSVAANGSSVITLDMINVSAANAVLDVTDPITIYGAKLTVDFSTVTTAQSITGSFSYLPPQFSIVLVSSTSATLATATVTSPGRYAFPPVSTAGMHTVRVLNTANNNAQVVSLPVTVTAVASARITLANGGVFVSADNIRGSYSGFPSSGSTTIYYQIGSRITYVTVRGATGSFTLAPAYAVGSLSIIAARNSGVVASTVATLQASILGSTARPVPATVQTGRTFQLDYSRFPTSTNNSGRRFYIGIVNNSWRVIMSVQVSAASGTVTLGGSALNTVASGYRVVGYDNSSVAFVASAPFSVVRSARSADSLEVEATAADTSSTTAVELELPSVETVIVLPPIDFDESVEPAVLVDDAEVLPQN